MIFESLKEKCEYYRSLGEHNLMPNGHILMMLDGRSFSKLVKNKFNKPFDSKFIDMMNQTAKYLCENISGVKFAYVQSDEISLYIQDVPTSGSFFYLRTTKLLSIAASLATAKFNQLMLINDLYDCNVNDKYEIIKKIQDKKLAEFDCKVWNVPNENDVFAWFLYRQLDCIRNSKQQTAQTYLPHKVLQGNSADVQIEMLKEQRGVDWNEFDNTKKFGRIIEKVMKDVPIPEQYVKDGVTTTMRGVWTALPMYELSEPMGRENIMYLIKETKE